MTASLAGVLPLAKKVTEHAIVHATWMDWIIVLAVPFAGFAVDMWLTRNDSPESPSLKRAATLSLAWLGTGLIVAGIVWLRHGALAGQEYLACWIVELSLSFDNVFTWSLAIGGFGLAVIYHNRLLQLGVIMAVVFRFAFLLGGGTLLDVFWWVSLPLAAILLFVGYKLIAADDNKPLDVKTTKTYRFVAWLIKIDEGDHDTKMLIVRTNHKNRTRIYITVFGVAVLVFASLDISFAFDSLPTVLALARDKFIILSSNAMAVLGLKSLYNLYEAVKHRFTKLNEVLALIMVFIAYKLIAGSKLPGALGFRLPEPKAFVSLAIVMALIAIGVIASQIWPEPAKSSEAAG